MCTMLLCILVHNIGPKTNPRGKFLSFEAGTHKFAGAKNISKCLRCVYVCVSGYNSLLLVIG